MRGTREIHTLYIIYIPGGSLGVAPPVIVIVAGWEFHVGRAVWIGRKSRSISDIFLASRSKTVIGSYTKSRCHRMIQYKQWFTGRPSDILPFNLPLNGDI